MATPDTMAIQATLTVVPILIMAMDTAVTDGQAQGSALALEVPASASTLDRDIIGGS